ncbi:MAG: biopolymer transporter ExbD [Treponema sp.]|nr:biopolymer transporter ExbD [Treponema sp.]
MKFKRQRRTTFNSFYPMSDLAFLLLIFIMLVALVHHRVEVNIQFALAETAALVDAERNLNIWVDKEGFFYLEGIIISADALEYSIAEVYINAPHTRIHIIADRDAYFVNVHKVLEILQRLEFPQVSFVVGNE